MGGSRRPRFRIAVAVLLATAAIGVASPAMANRIETRTYKGFLGPITVGAFSEILLPVNPGESSVTVSFEDDLLPTEVPAQITWRGAGGWVWFDTVRFCGTYTYNIPPSATELQLVVSRYGGPMHPTCAASGGTVTAEFD